jgi:hypothetical protein
MKRAKKRRGTYKGTGNNALLRDGGWLILDDFPIEVFQSLHNAGLVVVPSQRTRINEFHI